MASTPELIVITGPTASGKSGLAIEIAEAYDCEIICADSRTVYRNMNIGTAKPTMAEQKMVRHWLLDVVDPSEHFSVADFQKMARAAIADIRSRGKIPLLVGGTGLYIDAVVLDFEFGPKAVASERQKLEKMSVEQLILLHKKLQLLLPENKNNKRYLIRSVEKNTSTISGRTVPKRGTEVVALSLDKDELRNRITTRIDSMFESGLLKETQYLLNTYGSDNEAITGNAYRIAQKIIAGELTKPDAVGKLKVLDWRLAKRQITWLKRHEYVQWLSLKDARLHIENLLKSRDS